MNRDGPRPTRGFRRSLTSTQGALLVQSGDRRRYPKGGVLLRLGDLSRWVGVLVAGRVKVVHHAADGSELLLAVRGPGDLLGEFALGDGLPRSATVQAMEVCIAYKVGAASFESYVAEHDLTTALSRYVVAKARQSDRHAWRLAHRHVPERLARLFVEVLSACGPDHPEPSLIPLSQDEMAGALGVVRSAVTPVLASWRERGLIRQGRAKVFVLDVPTIRRLSEM